MILSDRLYSLEELDSLLEEFKFIKTTKKIAYANVPLSFDIETTSAYQNDVKIAFMYAFVFGINGKTIFARKWSDFVLILEKLSNRYELNESKRMIVYVHNLSFEFQFISKILKWKEIFATDERKPLTALTENGIEFRCSYMLSGMSLAKVAENLQTFQIKKMTGDLDYSLIRHSETPMTDLELGYILNDALIVMAYVQEQITNCGNITKIPLTKTGFVRKYVKEKCFFPYGHTKESQKAYYAYLRKMEPLKITSEKMYYQLKRAFHGGFTHASALNSGMIHKDVTSYDFTSSYPTVLIAEKFPMTTFRKKKIKNRSQFNEYIDKFACLFDVTFYNIEAKYPFIDNPISSSKCYELEDESLDNGRVSQATKLSTTLTEMDYKIIEKFYHWGKMTIKNFRIAMKAYLPTSFVSSILDLYVNKTKLKDVEGKEYEYLKSKELLNSCFGMCVTDILQSEYKFKDGVWSLIPPDIEKTLKKYNESRSRYIYYGWGVWTTSLAMYNLFSGIFEFGKDCDYIYSDTDSIKVLNAAKHQEYIKSYNEKIIDKLEKAMDFHKLPRELIRPKTIKGIEKPLGVWDLDHKYKRFKTLGAKRYMWEEYDGKFNLTVSGINKKNAIPYIIELAKIKKKDPLDLFDDKLYIPPEYTGKNTHTYLDYPQKGKIIDYRGIEGEYDELSSVHLEGAEYSLSMSEEYINYLLQVKEIYL